MKSVKNGKKKRSITDLNAQNGSRDISFQSQEFGQDGHRPIAGFQPHFRLNMTSLQDNEKKESAISQKSFV